MNEISRLKRGMKVSDIGYHPVGRVEAVTHNSFELDIADDGMVWLGEDVLFHVSEGGATLVCNWTGIERYEE